MDTRRRPFPFAPVSLSLLLLSVWPAAPSDAKNPAELDVEMKELVEASLQRYREIETEIAEEKAPLVARLNELESANLEKRAVVESYRFQADQTQIEIESLGKDLVAARAKRDYIETAFDGFLAKFDSRINMAESQRYLDPLTVLRDIANSDGSSTLDKYKAYTDSMSLSLDRIEAVIGGDTFVGKAIDEKGRIHEGKILVAGPSGFFLSDTEEIAGVTKFGAGTVEPGVTFLSGANKSAVQDFFSGSEGFVPLDATLGEALTIEASRGSIVSHVQQGGYVGYFILLLGMIALVVSIVKVADLRNFVIASPSKLAELARVAREGDSEAALSEAKKVPGVSGEMLATGIQNIKTNALLLEETMLSVVLRNKPKMERFLPYLAITAAASPLLGLLGTVVGLIKTFALITLYGAGAPKALSSGISEALVTTELGLAVAIPTLILHGLFSRVVKTRIGALEQSAFDFVKAASLEPVNRSNR